NPDGSIDKNFGTQGITTTNYGFGNDHVNAIALQSDGSIIAAGYAYNGTDKDYAVARYLPDFNLGVIDRKNTQQVATIYPNSIKKSARREYELASSENVSSKLYDLLGNQRATFVNNEIQSAGKHSEQINFPNNLSAGSYYLIIETKEGRVSVKVIKE